MVYVGYYTKAIKRISTFFSPPNSVIHTTMLLCHPIAIAARSHPHIRIQPTQGLSRAEQLIIKGLHDAGMTFLSNTLYALYDNEQ